MLTTITYPVVYHIDDLYLSILSTFTTSLCPWMQELVNELGSNGAFSGILAADSSNVVSLVQELYNVSKKKYHTSL